MTGAYGVREQRGIFRHAAFGAGVLIGVVGVLALVSSWNAVRSPCPAPRALRAASLCAQVASGPSKVGEVGGGLLLLGGALPVLITLLPSSPLVRALRSMCVQAERAPVVLYSKVAKPADQGKLASKPRSAKTQKLADFMVTGGFDVPDHPPGVLFSGARLCCCDASAALSLPVHDAVSTFAWGLHT